MVFFIAQGVYAVDVYPEKKLVAVTGRVDPIILLQSITKWGKSAELLSYTKNPKNSNKHAKQDPEWECEHEIGNKHKNVPPNGRERNRGIPKDDRPRKEKSDHEPEAYIAPTIDEKVCRDPYCKLHKCRPIFHNKVPSRDSADHPHHTQGSSHGSEGGTQFFNHGNYFPYEHPRMPADRMMESGFSPRSRSHGYGLYSGGSYMPGFESFDNYNYYGDHGANYRGWPHM